MKEHDRLAIINRRASDVLIGNQVGASFDTRSPIEILSSMVEKGFLPGKLLEEVMSIEPVAEVATDMRQAEV